MKNLMKMWWFKLGVVIIYTIIVIAITSIVCKSNNKIVRVSSVEENENVEQNQENDIQDTTNVEDLELQEKKEYINNKIKVYDVKAKYMDSLLDGRVPGLIFKIKNNGKKTLSKLEITFYYKNKKGDIIYENSYTPIDSSNIYVGTGTEKELKPNYVWQLESDKFYTDKKVPKEWKEGSIEYKITNIEY